MGSHGKIKDEVSYCAESGRDALGTPCQLSTGMGREMLMQSVLVWMAFHIRTLQHTHFPFR